MNGAMNVLNAGQSSDMHLMLARVAELMDVMRANRERTQSLMDTAEEIAIRAHATTTTSPSSQGDASAQAAAAAEAAHAERTAELTRSNHALAAQVRAYARETKENQRLIGEYETAVGQVAELVRDLAAKKDAQMGAQAREYNALLQDEKDRHLATRLARDEWQANAARAAGMLRTAYALRCAEDEAPVAVVRALQSEVRALRRVVGLEDEDEDKETGWAVLKDAPAGEEGEMEG